MAGSNVQSDMQAVADRLLEKLRHFISAELDPQERVLLATLLAPGVAAAHAGREDHDVIAFGMGTWAPPAVPEALADALDRGGVRVEGLGL